MMPICADTAITIWGLLDIFHDKVNAILYMPTNEPMYQIFLGDR